MKISTNFSSDVSTAVRSLLVIVWSATLLAVFCLIWLIYEAAGFHTEIPGLHKRLSVLESSVKNTALTEDMEKPDLSVLMNTRNKVSAINAITKTRGISTVVLLEHLEKLLPSQARLVSLHHRATQGEILLIATAVNAAPLSEFLLKLEQDPVFSEVLLLHDIQGKADTSVQYEIRLKVRS